MDEQILASYPSIHIKMLMKLRVLSMSMIGRILESLSWNMNQTLHCPHKCHRRAVPLCQTQQTELSHLSYLSLKNQRGPLKPQYSTLKNNYTLLWDMKNRGYINVVSMQGPDRKTTNPENYTDNEVQFLKWQPIF